MAQWQLELCQRHLQRLYTRLHGRGARKARELVRRLHDAIDRCCRDITGSRSEVHALLVEILGTELAGGDRNIRDCLDLLARESPLFRKDGHRCSIHLAQLHDPNSELIRWITEDEARAAEGSTAKTSPPPSQRQRPGPPPTTPEPGAPRVATTAAPPTATPPTATPPATTATLTPPMPLPAASPVPPRSSPPTPVPPPAESPVPPQSSPPTHPPSATEDPWAPGLGPYRALGAKDPTPSSAAFSNSRATLPTVTPGISSAFTTSPTAPIAGLLHDDPDDPYDPELESLASPSRTRLASRQKPPDPGDGGGTQGSS